MTRNNKTALAAAGDEHAKRTARVAADPVIAHSAIMSTLSKPLFGEADMNELCDRLERRVAKVKAGDLSSAEEMLTAQAATLNLLFLDLVRRAQVNMGEYIGAAERYLRLGLKAQAQCRSSLEALVAIKNPPVVIAKQANIANGPQQVNNGTGNAHAHTHAGNLESVPNGLLEANSGAGERLDGRTTGAAIGGDQAMATVGAIDGAAHG